MQDKKVFIDTNLFVYAIVNDDSNKHYRAVDILDKIGENIYVSPQIFNELYAVLLKNHFDDRIIQDQIRKIADFVNIIDIDWNIVEHAWKIKNQYHFSIWDSLVISSALAGKCSILYSEDMQHKQIIKDSLTVLNPFLLNQDKNI